MLNYTTKLIWLLVSPKDSLTHYLLTFSRKSITFASRKIYINNMEHHETYVEQRNRLAYETMAKQVALGHRKLSYELFKRLARNHQGYFREHILHVECHQYPNVLTHNDAAKGLIFFDGFRQDIMEELKKPVPVTSTAPSGQMLTNLLRSEHIPYNVFFPMKKDLEGCKQLFNAIFGREEVAKAQDILIEYHPEPIEEYLNDHTAFDVYIQYLNNDKQPCGIGIEVKYTEKEYPLIPNSREYSHVKDENGNTRLSGAYSRVTNDCNYYKDDVSLDDLVSNKFRQIWRNHILGASMVLHGDLAKFTSITFYPQENIHFSMDAMPTYQELLNERGRSTFIALNYETMFELMAQHLHVDHQEAWIDYLKNRYLFTYPKLW